MTADEARAILKAPQFNNQLRRVGRVNQVRLPTIRRGGCIDLLPEGYDEATQTLTFSSAAYADDLPFASGVKAIRDLFSEFKFSDSRRTYPLPSLRWWAYMRRSLFQKENCGPRSPT